MRTPLRVCFAILLVCGAVGCGSRHERVNKRIYVPVVFQSGIALRYQPHKLIYTGDGSSYVDHLRYRSYGGPRATAVGVDEIDDCQPACANGRYHPVRADVRLWHVTRCRGKRIYAMFEIDDAPAGLRFQKMNPLKRDLRYLSGCPVPTH